MNSVLLHVVDTMEPDDVKPPTWPYHWVYFTLITEKGYPTFDQIKTQADGVASNTALCLRLDHKEEKTRLVLYQLSAIKFFQINTMLLYLNMEFGSFFTKGERSGKTRMWQGITLLKMILPSGLLCRTINFLETTKDTWMRSFLRRYGWNNPLLHREIIYISAYIYTVRYTPIMNPGGQTYGVLF